MPQSPQCVQGLLFGMPSRIPDENYRRFPTCQHLNISTKFWYRFPCGTNAGNLLSFLYGETSIILRPPKYLAFLLMESHLIKFLDIQGRLSYPHPIRNQVLIRMGGITISSGEKVAPALRLMIFMLWSKRYMVLRPHWDSFWAHQSSRLACESTG